MTPSVSSLPGSYENRIVLEHELLLKINPKKILLTELNTVITWKDIVFKRQSHYSYGPTFKIFASSGCPWDSDLQSYGSKLKTFYHYQTMVPSLYCSLRILRNPRASFVEWELIILHVLKTAGSSVHKKTLFLTQ